MPNFDYVALTSQGREVRGAIEAPDLAAARQTLRGRALMPLKLDLEGSGSLLSGSVRAILRNPTRLLPAFGNDKQFFFRQLALMVKSGHRLRNALETVGELVFKRSLSAAIRRMIGRIDKGQSFASALEAEGRMFPRHVSALVAAGEKSGTLDQILDEVAGSMERLQALQNTVMRAVVMPVITLFVAFFVLGFVVLWLVPILVPFLISNGGEIHWTMQSLISVTDFMTAYGKLLAMLTGLAIFALMLAYTTVRGRLVLDRAMILMPIFGRTIVLFEMSRLGGIGMLLIRSGLRQVEALRVLADVTQNRAYRAQYNAAAEHLLSGQSMSEALNVPIFDRLARHMIRVGEASGGLEEVLDRLGVYFSDEVETRIRMLIGTMVPAITILVGLVVAIIYLSVILTVLGAYNSVR